MSLQITKFNGKYSFLSNFYRCDVPYLNYIWLTSEHAYQAAKAKTKKDRNFFKTLLTPGAAKRWGQNLDLRDDWEEVKLKVMEEVLISKFTNNIRLGALLLGTYPQELIEGNTWGDSFWGVCNGKGQNHLGKFLMKIRDQGKKQLICRKSK